MLVSGVLLATGLLCCLAGARMAEFRDPAWEAPFDDSSWHARMDDAFTASTKGHPQAYDALAEEWFAARAKALSSRDGLIDTGLGLTLLGMTALIGLMALRRTAGHWPRISDLGSLASPRTLPQCWVFVAVTWLSFVPGEWIYYFYTGSRGDHPWFGDAIAIPCFSVLVIGVLGLPFLLGATWVVLRRARLPGRLFARPWFGPFYVVSAALWAVAAMALVVTVGSVFAQPFIVPSSLMTLYLALSGRAAVCQGLGGEWSGSNAGSPSAEASSARSVPAAA
jgi:hypothetical protein